MALGLAPSIAGCLPCVVFAVGQRHRDQAALALLVYAGLRIQQTRYLQLRDLDFAGGMITIRRGLQATLLTLPATVRLVL
jgi:integrase